MVGIKIPKTAYSFKHSMFSSVNPVASAIEIIEKPKASIFLVISIFFQLYPQLYLSYISLTSVFFLAALDQNKLERQAQGNDLNNPDIHLVGAAPFTCPLN